MWLELAGGGAGWLAHVLWYVTVRERVRALRLASWLESDVVVALTRSVAVLLMLLGIGFWVRAYGPALGGCAALSALMAAASVNTIIAPLSLRWLVLSGALATCVLSLGTWQWLRGA